MLILVFCITRYGWRKKTASMRESVFLHNGATLFYVSNKLSHAKHYWALCVDNMKSGPNLLALIPY